MQILSLKYTLIITLSLLMKLNLFSQAIDTSFSDNGKLKLSFGQFHDVKKIMQYV